MKENSNLVGKSKTDEYTDDSTKKTSEKEEQIDFDAEIEPEETSLIDVKKLRSELMQESDMAVVEHDDPVPDDELSTGMDYEQLSTALEAVAGVQLPQRKRVEAGKVLKDLSNTELLEILSSQAVNEDIIGQLVEEYLSSGGRAESSRPHKPAAFDWTKYT